MGSETSGQRHDGWVRICVNVGIGVALGLIALTGCSKNTEAGEPHPLLLANIPTGLSASVTLTLPEDHPTNDFFYSALLYDGRSVGLGQVAIFLRDLDHDEVPGTDSFLGRVGPRGQGVYRAFSATTERMVFGDLDEHQLRDVALGADPGSGFELVAEQPIATVPGIGSLPVPPRTTGYVISYISDNEEHYQQSVAIGTYAGAGTDLRILQWWYGDAVPFTVGDIVGARFEEEVLGSEDGTLPPSAVFWVWEVDGVVTIVRVVGTDLDEPEEVVQATRRIEREEWDQLGLRP